MSVLPTGGTSQSNGGQGIFYDNQADTSLRIWVDTEIRERSAIYKHLEREGATISLEHWSEDTQLIILSPRSVRIFDSYCHPAWLTVRDRAIYAARQKRAEKRGAVWEEEWTKKVLLKAWWVDRCVASGRFLGENDNWGGCHAGGPPTNGKTYLASPIPAKYVPLPTPPGSLPDNSPRQSPLPVEAPHIDSPPLETRAKDAEPTGSLDLRKDDGITPADIDAAAALTVAPAANSASPEVIEDGVIWRSAREAIVPDAGTPSTHGDTLAEEKEILLETREDTTEKRNEEPEHKPEVVDQNPAVQPNSGVDIVMTETDAVVPATTPPVPLTIQSASAADVVMSNATADAATDASPVPPTYMGAEQETETLEIMEERSTARVVGESQVEEGEVPERSEHPRAESTGPAINEAEDIELPPPYVPDDPSQLFEGFRFWVDPKRPSRRELLNRIIAAGGRITMDYSEATHVLVHSYKPQEWDSIIHSVVRMGVWFMQMAWVLKCLDEGKRYPELGYHVRGGAPVLLDLEEDIKPQMRSAPPSQKKMETEQLNEIFEKEVPSSTGMTLWDFASMLIEKYGTYTNYTWQNLVREWKTRTGRFNGFPRAVQIEKEPTPMAPLPSLSASPALQDESESKESQEKQDVPAPLLTGKQPVSAPKEPFTIDRLDDVLRASHLERQQRAIRNPDKQFEKHSKGTMKMLRATFGVFGKNTWLKLYRIWRKEVGIKDKPLRQSKLLPKSDELLKRMEEAAKLAVPQYQGEHRDPNASISYADSSISSGVHSRKSASPEDDGDTGTNHDSPPDSTSRNESGNLEPETGGVTISSEVSEENHKSPGLESNAQDSATPTAPSQFLSQSSSAARHAYTTEELDRMFIPYGKLFQSGVSRMKAAEMIHKEYPKLATGTWGVYLGEWLRGVGRFAGMSGVQFSTGTSASGQIPSSQSAVEEPQSQSQSQSQGKRSVEDETWSEVQPSKRQKAKTYSIDDEKKMGWFVASKYPSAVKFKDWAEFAAMYPSHTPGAWAEHYRVYKATIDDHAKAKGRPTKAESPSQERPRSASTTSSVVYLRRKSESEDVEYVDMTGLVDSDDDDATVL